MKLEDIRRAIESLYLGICNIKVRQKTFNVETKQYDFSERTIYENEPCRLSYSNINYNKEKDGAARKQQIIKLFIAPELEIPSGCRIEITQNNRTAAYKSSSEPAVYRNHQEIELENFDKWA